MSQSGAGILFGLISGAGGVGRTTAAVHLAARAADGGGRVLLISDRAADGSRPWPDAPRTLRCAAFADLGADLRDADALVAGLRERKNENRFVIADAGAGVSERTHAVAAAADRLVMVSAATDESLADTLGALKLLRAGDWNGACNVLLVGCSEACAVRAGRRLRRAARECFGVAISEAEFVPEDARLRAAAAGVIPPGTGAAGPGEQALREWAQRRLVGGLTREAHERRTAHRVAPLTLWRRVAGVFF